MAVEDKLNMDSTSDCWPSLGSLKLPMEYVLIRLEKQQNIVIKYSLYVYVYLLGIKVQNLNIDFNTGGAQYRVN